MTKKQALRRTSSSKKAGYHPRMPMPLSLYWVAATEMAQFCNPQAPPPLAADNKERLRTYGFDVYVC
jgi:hypothetical protein